MRFLWEQMSIQPLHNPCYKVIYGIYGCSLPLHITKSTLFICTCFPYAAHCAVNYMLRRWKPVHYTEFCCLPGNCKRSKNRKTFFPPECALLPSSSAHSNQGRSIPLPEQCSASCAAPHLGARASLLRGRILLWEWDLTPVSIPLCI